MLLCPCRALLTQHPSLPSLPTAPPAAERILGKGPELKADFARAAGAVSKAKQKGVARFPLNPGALGGGAAAVAVGWSTPGGRVPGLPSCHLTHRTHCLPAAEANWGPKQRHSRGKQQKQEEREQQEQQQGEGGDGAAEEAAEQQEQQAANGSDAAGAADPMQQDGAATQ